MGNIRLPQQMNLIITGCALEFEISQLSANNFLQNFDSFREEWESKVLKQTVDLTKVQIDPSPFQLVGTTSLFKVHSLFSLLGLKRAYVTRAGQLVGVISLHNPRIRKSKTCQSGRNVVERTSVKLS
ncbi:unnamed protein product [Nippostrongylus brasiliensis]|uniref:CBS domain-containing protein n=1 Tax=Nippostrongylus brasiliensis TaxID=27835 RepID=A0A0N4XRY3_NIPBR|nr:unnamed protein product [Nippostrongylus brasiliensis]